MSRPEPAWKRGLQSSINEDDVYEPFRVLLESHLPISDADLARKVGKNRTTVTKWKSVESKAPLASQREAIQTVRKRLEEMTQHVDAAEAMTKALEAVEAAHLEHRKEFDPETLAPLREANDQVRALLNPADD